MSNILTLHFHLYLPSYVLNDLDKNHRKETNNFTIGSNICNGKKVLKKNIVVFNQDGIIKRLFFNNYNYFLSILIRIFISQIFSIYDYRKKTQIILTICMHIIVVDVVTKIIME